MTVLLYMYIPALWDQLPTSTDLLRMDMTVRCVSTTHVYTSTDLLRMDMTVGCVSVGIEQCARRAVSREVWLTHTLHTLSWRLGSSETSSDTTYITSASGTRLWGGREGGREGRRGRGEGRRGRGEGRRGRGEGRRTYHGVL